MEPCSRILVVEDDEDIRDTLKQLLELEGYDVHTASNGQEGVEVLKQIERPCLILLDLMMPVMNGWEFLRERRRDQAIAGIPVIVVTAAGTDRGTTPEANCFIRKPIDLETLLRMVSKFCVPLRRAEAA